MTSTFRPRLEGSHWSTTVQEIVRLRREETAADSAAENALVEELHRAFKDSQRPDDESMSRCR